MRGRDFMRHNLAVAILNFDKGFNVANIIRTANAAAVREVVIIGRKDWNKSASTGAHGFTEIRHVVTIDDFFRHVEFQGYNMVSVEIDERAESIFSCQYPKMPIFIIGNEGRGISEKILEKSSKIVTIPQFGQVECLNAATSAAIVIFDWIRRYSDFRLCCNIRGSKYKA